jgi:hypothetical protein
VKVRALEILFILIAGIGIVFFNSHPLPAETAGADSMVDSTKAEVQLDSAKAEMQHKAAAIFRANCAIAGCHRGEHPKKDLNLEPEKFLSFTVNVASQEKKDLKRLDTINPEESYLLMKIKGEKGFKGSRMPDEAPPLKKEEIEAIEDWIFSVKEAKVGSEKTTEPIDSMKTPKDNQ